MERIQKVVANSGYCSRRKAEKLIKEGKVLVNNLVVTELGTKVSANDQISVEGNFINNDNNYVYYLLNKPRSIVCTTSDECGRKTVIDIINCDKRIYPIGRLDYDTTGIILLTNDGVLANKLMHPSSNIDKKYVAKVQGFVNPKEISLLRDGVLIEGHKTSKAKVKLKKYDKKTDKSTVEITIHEGKNHQIKKMFESIQHPVIKLKREEYANLNLIGLKSGEYRLLTTKEVKTLYSLVK